MRIPAFFEPARLPRPSKTLPLVFALLLLPFATSNPALAQTALKGVSISANVFGQFTGTRSGKASMIPTCASCTVTDKPSRSLGVLASVRKTYKPWLGYEVNYSYTRFSEAYNTYPFAVQDNVHEFTAAYLIHAPKLLFFRPFAAAGSGLLFFMPTTVGGQKQDLQVRYPFLYELGVDLPLATHFGARLEYRGFLYKTPDFGNPLFKTGAMRQTSEPTVGLYVRF